jgi:hypothetical protein
LAGIGGRVASSEGRSDDPHDGDKVRRRRWQFRPSEQVAEAAARGTVAQVGAVQRGPLHQQNTQYIAPLAVGHLVASTEPAQLLKQDVLGGVDVEMAVTSMVDRGSPLIELASDPPTR